MLKIAISGKKRSGKDTLAKTLVKEYELNFEGFGKTYAIADRIKEIAIKDYGMDSDPTKKDGKLLENIGDKMRQVVDGSGKVHTNVFCESLIEQMKEDDNGDGIQVVSDMRLLEEYEALKNAGFLMVRIEADEEVRKTRLDQNETRDENHRTNTELDDPNIKWDRVVQNNGDLSDLDAEAFTILTLARLGLGEQPA